MANEDNLKHRRKTTAADPSVEPYGKNTSDDENNRVQKTSSCSWPIPFSTSKYLVCSSCFFLLPAILGFYMDLPVTTGLAALSMVTSFVSAIHWWNCHSAPELNIRHCADLVVAKLSFLIYFILGVAHVYYSQYATILWTLGIPILIAIVACYRESFRRWKEGEAHIWWKFHCGFHLAVACEQAIVILGCASQ